MLKSRMKWVDIAKGYGILFVIFGHLDSSYLRTEIYTFHLPLFFFLSGFVFSVKKYKFKEFLKRKTISFIVPYISLGIPMIMFTFISYIYNQNRNLSDYLKIIYSFVIQRRMWTLWFIACLFFLNILFYILVKIVNFNYKKLGIIVAMLTVIGLIYYKIGGIPLPWNIDVCLTALPFFYVGFLFNQIQRFHDILLRIDRRIIYFILFLFINIACGILTKKISGSGLEMYACSYGFAPLTFLSAFAGIFCVIIISYNINIKPIECIGRNSLIYFAWHQTIMMPIINKLYEIFNLYKYEVFSLPLEILSLIIICITLTIADFTIRNTKLCFMLGIKPSHNKRNRLNDDYQSV